MTTETIKIGDGTLNVASGPTGATLTAFNTGGDQIFTANIAAEQLPRLSSLLMEIYANHGSMVTAEDMKAELDK